MDETLQGGYNSAPIRHGDTVIRSTGPWSRNVHALLHHLHTRGFIQAPRVLDTDPAAGTETLTYIHGQPGTYPLTPTQRSEQALIAVARTIRAMHEATTGFTAPDPSAWQARTVLPVDIDCIGHNDLGPYNIVYGGDGTGDTEVAAIIDWDFAGPSNRVWDLSYAAHRFVPLSAPRSTQAFGFDFGVDPVPAQRARLRTFLDAYGTDASIDVAYLLDVLVLRLSAITAHIERGVLAGDPRFDRQREERHGDGYREDMAYILQQRSQLGS
ncbi:phosphotransferase [Kineococcus sp. SYSU DK005]|uniref:phosphotransferase n=1 Tax=Kineococcus sp. SYSU DK005 TaxID=3383126 RepID=UPI003D7E5DF4